jgi:hypothetical protein
MNTPLAEEGAAEAGVIDGDFQFIEEIERY